MKPRSSFVTPLHADSIFGSLMWALRYLEGEKKLLEVLETFDNAPPFILSNGYPEGYLPVPILPLETMEKVSLEAVHQLKKIKKLTYMPEPIFRELVENLNSSDLKEELLKWLENLKWKGPIFQKTESNYKNVINRLNFTTLRGGLFVQDEIYFNPEINWCIYLKLNKEQELLDLDRVINLFEFLSKTGFGKKKSSGKGQFELLDFKSVSLPNASSPNGFVALSNFVPNSGDPTDGYYEIVLKYGKLGGEFAYTMSGPWKKPLRMLRAGSVFKLTGELKDFYGKMVSNIYPPLNTVRQYAYAFPLGVNLK
jgi:CRISPR-associated protein Csm4